MRAHRHAAPVQSGQPTMLSGVALKATVAAGGAQASLSQICRVLVFRHVSVSFARVRRAGKETLQQVAAAIDLLDGASSVTDDLAGAGSAAAIQKRIAKCLGSLADSPVYLAPLVTLGAVDNEVQRGRGLPVLVGATEKALA